MAPNGSFVGSQHEKTSALLPRSKGFGRYSLIGEADQAVESTSERPPPAMKRQGQRAPWPKRKEGCAGTCRYAAYRRKS